jgi:hypothetical protein
MRTKGYWISIMAILLIYIPACIAREETWIEVKSPNFRVISDASPKQARRTARSFEQFRLLLKNFIGQEFSGLISTCSIIQ